MCAHVHPTTLTEITTVTRGIIYTVETSNMLKLSAGYGHEPITSTACCCSGVVKFGSMQLLNGLKLSALPLEAGSLFAADQLGGPPGFTIPKLAAPWVAKVGITCNTRVLPVRQ